MTATDTRTDTVRENSGNGPAGRTAISSQLFPRIRLRRKIPAVGPRTIPADRSCTRRRTRRRTRLGLPPTRFPSLPHRRCEWGARRSRHSCRSFTTSVLKGVITAARLISGCDSTSVVWLHPRLVVFAMWKHKPSCNHSRKIIIRM